MFDFSNLYIEIRKIISFKKLISILKTKEIAIQKNPAFYRKFQ